MPFLPPNQQHQSTEGTCLKYKSQAIYFSDKDFSQLMMVQLLWEESLTVTNGMWGGKFLMKLWMECARLMPLQCVEMNCSSFR